MMRAQSLDPVFSRVLGGTDGSSAAEEAVRQAARLASATGAVLEIAHVYDPSMPAVALAGGARRRRLSADESLDRAVRVARTEGAPAVSRLLLGGPATALVREAKSRWADLISVGPDAGFFERPHALGGVALHTVRRARCSVLVARPAAAPDRFPGRILCATDGSPASLEAVRLSARLAALFGAAYRLLHVVKGYFQEAGEPDGPPAGAEPSLRSALRLASKEGIAADADVETGNPGPAIAETAERWDADLIVLGPHVAAGAPRLLSANTAEWVAMHASRSVLIARPRDHW
jgi:nucleotide-binding universal stress UspA family protein